MRQITVEINGNFVKKDGKNAGTQGEANVTALHLVFDSSWEGYSKRLLWRDANGENPVAVLLYNDLSSRLSGEDPLVFDALIPSEPLSKSGWCSFTVEGYRSHAPESIAYSVSDTLFVSPNDSSHAPAEPTPSQAAQLHEEIDGILSQVSEIVGEAEEALRRTEGFLSVWEPWDGQKAYSPLEKVYRLGSSYLCIAPCSGVQPETDTENGDGARGSFWQKIAEKGERGETGPKGNPGPIGPQGVAGFSLAVNGTVAFNVENGHLILYCMDAQNPPGFFLGNDGHLYLDL